MTDAIENMGPRLKSFRLKSGRSLREIARQLNVSPSFVSQIENGKSQPSVSTLYSFARLLGVTLDELFETEGSALNKKSMSDAASKVVSRDTFETPSDAWLEEGAKISAVNPANRQKINMDTGVHWERLASTLDKRIAFMEIVYEAGAVSNTGNGMMSHEGYEYGYALEGSLELTIGDIELSLTKGHSIGFDSSIPHKFRNPAPVAFRGIWVNHNCENLSDR